MQSKDIIILIFGVVLSGMLAVFFEFFDLSKIFSISSFVLLWFVILVLFLIVVIGIWVLYMRIRESEIDLLEQATEQKRLGEKLKIYERLNKLELEVENLKNAKRK
jgi:hypothetical protein